MRERRVYIISLLVIIFSFILINRLFEIQVKNNEYWRALAKGQQTILKKESPRRGDIFFEDKKGKVYLAATNKEKYFCYLVPGVIKDKEKTSESLSNILGIDQKIILEKINSSSNYFILKDNLTEKEAKDIEKLNILGVYIGRGEKRYYPQGEEGAHILGFVGGENVGQYGLEEFYNKELSGKPGEIFGERDVKGVLTFLYPKSSLPEDGADIVLTVDYYIQLEAESLLEKAAKDLEIRGGQIIVENPQTGEIKALAVWPKYDPNNYKEFKVSTFINPTLQLLFEPGSVFKAITMAAALDLGKITPQTKYTDKGYVKVGGYTIYNYGRRTWGERTMTEVLERSINTGAVFAENQISHQDFLNYIEKFGFFEKTGIDLSGEVFSENKELKKGYEVNFATASFGQGIEVTPIQLIRAYGAIANNGKIMRPFIVKEIRKKNGEIIQRKPVIQRESVISSKTAQDLKEMLISVVEKGYGRRAKIPGYFIAGKTGTSQIPWPSLGISKRGYSDETWQTFIGFFPAYDPKFLILIKLDNPKTKTSEYSAAPIFHDLAKYIIDYWQIPPDYNPEEGLTK